MALPRAMSLLQGIIIFTGIKCTGKHHRSIQLRVLWLAEVCACCFNIIVAFTCTPLIKANWSDQCCLSLAGTDRGKASAVCSQLLNQAQARVGHAQCGAALGRCASLRSPGSTAGFGP